MTSTGTIRTDNLELFLELAWSAAGSKLDEALDFLRFLKSRHAQETRTERVEAMLLSESSLAKDWLHPEEDEAWADL